MILALVRQRCCLRPCLAVGPSLGTSQPQFYMQIKTRRAPPISLSEGFLVCAERVVPHPSFSCHVTRCEPRVSDLGAGPRVQNRGRCWAWLEWLLLESPSRSRRHSHPQALHFRLQGEGLRKGQLHRQPVPLH